MKTELRRMRRDGEHDIIEEGTPQVHTTSVYPDRITIFIGKRHMLRMSKADAAWLAEQLTIASSKP